MEHDQLIEEMNQIERLTTAERLRLARYLINYASFYSCLFSYIRTVPYLKCTVAYTIAGVNQINPSILTNFFDSKKCSEDCSRRFSRITYNG